jgi:predicted DCC family thiol-disulfide oxidoreductase YuxK
VLFDGVCNLCHGAVAFIIRRDPRGVFRFAPLQSAHGAALLGAGGAGVPDSLVLVEGGRVYTQSTAALRIARRLRKPWPLVSGLIVLPRGVRDWLYEWVARNRYRWFGRRGACELPSPGVDDRFLR